MGERSVNVCLHEGDRIKIGLEEFLLKKNDSMI